MNHAVIEDVASVSRCVTMTAWFAHHNAIKWLENTTMRALRLMPKRDRLALRVHADLGNLHALPFHFRHGLDNGNGFALHVHGGDHVAARTTTVLRIATQASTALAAMACAAGAAVGFGAADTDVVNAVGTHPVVGALVDERVDEVGVLAAPIALEHHGRKGGQLHLLVRNSGEPFNMARQRRYVEAGSIAGCAIERHDRALRFAFGALA